MAGRGGGRARAFTVGDYALWRQLLRKSKTVCDGGEVEGWAVDAARARERERERGQGR